MKNIIIAIQTLLVKLLRSRKAFFQLVSKIIAGYLIIALHQEVIRCVVFVVSGLFDLIYAGIITFEKVKTELKAEIKGDVAGLIGR